MIKNSSINKIFLISGKGLFYRSAGIAIKKYQNKLYNRKSGAISKQSARNCSAKQFGGQKNLSPRQFYI
jgi:hypothetical protein